MANGPRTQNAAVKVLAEILNFQKQNTKALRRLLPPSFDIDHQDAGEALQYLLGLLEDGQKEMFNIRYTPRFDACQCGRRAEVEEEIYNFSHICGSISDRARLSQLLDSYPGYHGPPKCRCGEPIPHIAGRYEVPDTTKYLAFSLTRQLRKDYGKGSVESIPVEQLPSILDFQGKILPHINFIHQVAGDQDRSPLFEVQLIGEQWRLQAACEYTGDGHRGHSTAWIRPDLDSTDWYHCDDLSVTGPAIVPLDILANRCNVFIFSKL